MAKTLSRPLIQVGLFLDIVKALAALQPTPTIVGQLDLRIPEPTPRAILGEVSNPLARRDANTLCGYVDGNLNYPVSCGGGSVCALATAFTAAGCCDPNALAYCELPSTCIPYGGVCDEDCETNNAIYTSCGYLAPYCITGLYEYGYEDGYGSSTVYGVYVCGTLGGIYTILPSATGLAPENVVTAIAVVTQTAAATVSAAAIQNNGNSGGPGINCFSGSICDTGNNNSGNNNGAGNKPGDASTRKPASSCYLLSLVCAVVLAWL